MYLLPACDTGAFCVTRQHVTLLFQVCDTPACDTGALCVTRQHVTLLSQVCNTPARDTAVSSVWNVSLLTNVPEYETQYFICVKHYVTSCDQNANTCWTTCSCPGHIIIISRLLKKLTNTTIIQLKKKLRCGKELTMDGKIVLVRKSVSSCLCRLLEWYSQRPSNLMKDNINIDNWYAYSIKRKPLFAGRVSPSIHKHRLKNVLIVVFLHVTITNSIHLNNRPLGRSWKVEQTCLEFKP